MKEVLDAKFFIGNRRRLQKQVESGVPIVVTAHGLLQRGGDSAYPFYQDSSFWYLTGIDEPDALLVIDKSGEYLILPDSSPDRDIFGESLNHKDLSKVSGIETVLSGPGRFDRLKVELKKSKKAATLGALPAFVEHYGMYTNPARARLIERLKEAEPGLEIVDIRPLLAQMRVVKQPTEIRAIQSAIDMTVKTVEEIKPELSRYSFEYEIEADISRGFRSRGASGHAFQPIVAAGKRACVLHNMNNNCRLKQGDLIVLDVGAEISHYAADITRTFSIGGKPSVRQHQVFDAVKAVQDYAFGLQKPGASIKDNEKKIERFMGEKLQELGLIDRIDRKSVREYYPHAASHYLGLDVHDAGELSAPLAPGMVLTVEPGIYIKEEGIGVRIEDDVLITDTGGEILSQKLPRTLV